jgi:hypothetical protein
VSDDQQSEFRSLSEFCIIIFLNKLKIIENTFFLAKIKIKRIWLRQRDLHDWLRQILPFSFVYSDCCRNMDRTNLFDEIKVLVWDRHKGAAWFNLLKGSGPMRGGFSRHIGSGPEEPIRGLWISEVPRCLSHIRFILIFARKNVFSIILFVNMCIVDGSQIIRGCMIPFMASKRNYARWN